MKTGLVATALCTLLALGGSLAAADAPPAHRAATPRADTSQVGKGWFLTTVDHGPPRENGIEHATSQRLVLVAPTGERHRVLERKLGRHQRGRFTLTDWSPDGSTALLVVAPGTDRQRALVVDVPSGASRTVPLGAAVATVALAPDGTDLWGTGYAPDGDTGARLFAIDRTGERTPLRSRLDGPWLASPDGTNAVTSGSDRQADVLRVLSATDGSVLRRMPTRGHCQPVRWWSDTSVEVSCWGSGRQTLSRIDVRSGEQTRITHGRAGRQDLGHLDARRVTSGLYVQVAGPCGYVFIARQHRNGTMSPVRVPHAVGNVLLVGATAHRLVLAHAISCDGSAPRAALTRFDPVTGHERVLTRLPADEAFDRILGYGERQASAY